MDNNQHYRKMKIQPIEVIEANGYGFHRGNALKYIMRAGLKEGVDKLEDLEKAADYIDREIALEKKKAQENQAKEVGTDQVQGGT